MPELAGSGFLHVAGKAIEYAFVPGTGDAPTIVLLHEGLGCCAMWRDFPQLLSERCKASVFSYSRAGYGHSDGAGLPWPLSYMHDEAAVGLPGVLEAAGIERPVLVGHSDGGSIAAIYAGGDGVDRITGLVLMAAHVVVEDISVSSIARARTAFEQESLRERLERYHGINTCEAFYGWNDSWLAPDFRDWDITTCLGTIRCPVLALQGADDEYGTPAQLDLIAAGCGGQITTELIAGCGHAPHRDQPEITLARIADFVAQL